MMRTVALILLTIGGWPAMASSAEAGTSDLWDLAQANRPTHRFSTLFTAHHVRDYLASDQGIDEAIDWCRKTAVSKVYLETFRSRYQAERETLVHARDRFRKAGFDVSGCVTTTIVGKQSTGWELISCFTDEPTQERLEDIFRFTAGLFDEIMIDDFWFTDCECGACQAGRVARKVTVKGQTYPVAGDRWEDYRLELMTQVSRKRILEPSRQVNPRVQIIIKYPQWFDRFHERGYDVVRQTADFELIWVGTETRDYDDERWGGFPQYGAYFLMRWLGGIGGPKCGGGWYDPLGTTPATYIEQARQTVLGGAAESMLFSYGPLLTNHGPADIEALRANIPELLAVAAEIKKRQPVGIAAYKPPHSHAEKEAYVFNFLGMTGLPLVACHEFPSDAPAAFFPVHAFTDRELPQKLAAYIATGRPVLVTDGLAAALAGRVDLEAANVVVLDVKGSPKSLLELSDEQLGRLRKPLLAPWKRTFTAPNRVALYLFDDGSWVAENFNDRPVEISLDGRAETIAPRGWQLHWR